MFDYISENKSSAIGMMVVAFLLVLVSFGASVYGAGADKPIPEEKRQSSVRRGGGGFLIFYSGGGVRGAGGRGAMGGGFRGGKN